MSKNQRIGYILMICASVDLLASAILLIYGQIFPGLFIFAISFAFLHFANRYLNKDV